MSQLARYSGCRTIEYGPVVFSVAAFWRLVFRPDVPGAATPTVHARSASPATANVNVLISHITSAECEANRYWVSAMATHTIGTSRRGK
jgi:hypothetical protein